MPRIGIVSGRDDLHALVVDEALNRRAGTRSFLIPSDCVAGHHSLTWSARGDWPSVVPTVDGSVEPATLDVIWWRRVNIPQRLPEAVSDRGHVDLINNDCRAGLHGVLLSDFSGRWVSHPRATAAAEDKILQLRVALGEALTVPVTLISQDPGALERFRAQVEGDVVVKTLRGTRLAPLLATRLQDAHLAQPESVSLAPAIYQEYIAGNKHVRACCFGEQIIAFLLESEDLDWRANLDIPVHKHNLSDDVTTKLIAVLRRLGLRMGVFDLKLRDDGDLVFLEVNPQGQFLFLEGISGVDTVTPFVEFLCRQAAATATTDPGRDTARPASVPSASPT